MAERALVTGGAGFVGLHLARHLLDSGVDVTLLDDFSRGRVDDDLRRISPHVRLVEHDLTTPVPDELFAQPFHTVYHLAAVVGVQRANENPGHVLGVNLRSTLQVLDWCRRHPPEVLFLSSTSEVADGAVRVGLSRFPTSEGVPFVLPDPTSPRASYALSKVVAEMLFRQHRDEFRVRIGRYHNIYGPRMGNSHVIPQFINRALDRQDPFAIYGAYQSRAFCYIDDAVAATVALSQLPTPDPVLANIGNDRQEVRIRDLAERVAALAGYRPEFDVHDPPPGSPQRRLPDLTVLRDTVGVRASVDLDRGLRATFDWYAAQRPVLAEGAVR